MGERLLKRKESISRKESSFDNFFFSLISGRQERASVNQRECIFKHHLCVGNMQTISPLSLSLLEDKIAVKYNLDILREIYHSEAQGDVLIF